MYLVLSALTSSPISLAAATKASACSFTVCMLPPSTLTSSDCRTTDDILNTFYIWGPSCMELEAVWAPEAV